MPSAASPQATRRDAIAAVLLALLLTVAWAARDWSNLTALRLPDTDDVVRLQQIRDWLDGQSFFDLTQHRLGLPPGLAMHWSRLPDLVPAAIIAMLTPLTGTHAAEFTAVIAWPLLLFAAALVLVASIARALGTSGVQAVIVAALAYPATTLFLPGRIDHHGFQLVLLLVLARSLIGTGTLAAGIAAGLATAASLAIGLETAPLLAVAGIAAILLWILGRDGSEARLAGYAGALLLGLAAASAALRTDSWRYSVCDGFTAELWRGATVAALAPALLAIYGMTRPLRTPRIIASLLVGPVTLAGALLFAPDCLHPYGAVDPLLARLWLANVAEAQPLFGAPLAHALGYAGLAIVGLVASALLAVRRGGSWPILLALQATALAITLVQLRGAYAGALLAAPALAALIEQARARGALPLAAAWLASAGLVYPLLGGALAARSDDTARNTQDCTDPAALARLATLPKGRLLAPIDLGAYALAATRLEIVAAPYHRNGRGNAAMYQFFLSDPVRSEALARNWGIDYVALCPDSFAEAGAGGASLAAELRAGHVPAWLKPIGEAGGMPLLFKVGD